MKKFKRNIIFALSATMLILSVSPSILNAKTSEGVNENETSLHSTLVDDSKEKESKVLEDSSSTELVESSTLDGTEIEISPEFKIPVQRSAPQSVINLINSYIGRGITLGTSDYQCVAVANQYMLDLFGFTTAGNGVYHAYQIYDWANSNYFIKILNEWGNPNSYPLPGDIVVFNPTPTNIHGHVGICQSADGLTIKLIQQDGFRPWVPTHVMNWSYNTVKGWLRPRYEKSNYPPVQDVYTSSDIEQRESIPFTKERRFDVNMPLNAPDKITQNGQNGEKIHTIRIHYKNNVETHRETISTRISINPVPKITTYGPTGYQEYVTKNTPIPFNTRRVLIPDMELNKEVTHQEGVNGNIAKKYLKTTYTNAEYGPAGQPVVESYVSETRVEPVEKIIHYGPKVKITEKTMTDQVQSDFNTIRRLNKDLDFNTERVSQEGEKGVDRVYKTVKYYENIEGYTGPDVEHTITKIETLTPAKDKIIEYGPRVITTKDVVKEQEKIPFETKRVFDSRLKMNVEVEKQEGVEGTLEKEYKVTRYNNIEGYDGPEEIRNLVKETIILKPVDKIINYGAKVEITEEEVIENEDIPFETERILDKTLGLNEEVTVQEGKVGNLAKKYKVTHFKNIEGYEGPENKKEFLSEGITLDPTKEIIHYGPRVEITSEDIVETEEIPFKTIRIADPTLEKGLERVTQVGKNGKLEKHYTLKKYKNIEGYEGEEEEKIFVSENVIVAPVNKIIRYGTYIHSGSTIIGSYSSASIPSKDNVVKESKNNRFDNVDIIKIDSIDYELIKVGKSNKQILDVAPIIQNSRTMLPMRFIAELIGVKVDYDEESRTAIFKKDNLTAKIQIDGDEIVLSNGEVIKMDSKTVIKNDRILLPLTNISKLFGLTSGNLTDGVEQDVEWNEADRTVLIFFK